MAIRVNIGCGQSPTPGWSNYDNSPAIRIGQSRLATGALKWSGLLNAGNLSYIDYCRRNDIKYAERGEAHPLCRRHGVGNLFLAHAGASRPQRGAALHARSAIALWHPAAYSGSPSRTSCRWPAPMSPAEPPTRFSRRASSSSTSHADLRRSCITSFSAGVSITGCTTAHRSAV